MSALAAQGRLACAQRPSATAGVEAAQTARFTQISEDDVLPALEMLSNKMRGNYSKLKTWSGRYQVEDRQRLESTGSLADIAAQPVAPPVLRVDSGEFKFDLDVASGKVAVDFKMKMPKVTEVNSGREVPLKTIESGNAASEQADGAAGGDGHGIDRRGFFQQSVVADDEYLHFEPMMTYGDFLGARPSGAVGRAAFRDPVKNARGQEWGVIPDPRVLFGDGMRYFEELDQLAKSLNFPVGKDFTAAKRSEFRSAVHVAKGVGMDSHYYKVTLAPPGEGNESVRIYDAAVDFNPVLVWQGRVGDKGVPGVNLTYSYQREEGVLVPTKIMRFSSVDKNGIKVIKHQRLLILMDSKVNKAVGPEAFTVARFGLENGERLVDRIAGAMYVMQNGQLAKTGAIDLGATAPTQSAPLVPRTSIVWWINVGFVAATIAVLIAVRFIRRTSGAKGGKQV